MKTAEKFAPGVFAEMDNVAMRAARQYHRAYPWVPVEDFHQEAWLKMLEQGGYDGSAHGDTPIGGYYWKIAITACGDLATKVTSPVRGCRKVRRRQEFRQLKGVGLEQPSGEGETKVRTEPRRELTVPLHLQPDQLLANAEWNHRTVQKMLALMGEQSLGEIAERVLLAGEDAPGQKELAEELGVHPWRVNRAVKQFRKAARVDDDLVELFQAQRT